MPLLTVTLRKGPTGAFKTDLLDAIHATLVAAGVPATDRFQRVIELDPVDFRFDPSYPDLPTARTEAFLLIEILWSVGRSVKVKRKFLGELMQALRPLGVDPEQVMVCFIETQWENWSFAGGRQLHA